MSEHSSPRGLSVPDMEVILAVTSKLAAPFDLMTMLSEVVNAAKQVLRLIDALDENDDVQDVYANFDISDSLLEAMEG